MENIKKRKHALLSILPVLLCLLLALFFLLPAKASAGVLLPVNNVTCRYDAEEDSFFVSWDPVEGADKYLVAVETKGISGAGIYTQLGKPYLLGFGGHATSGYLPKIAFTNLIIEKPEFLATETILLEDPQDSFKVVVYAENDKYETVAQGETEPFATGIPKLGAPENVKLEETGKVSWDEVEHAEGYSVVLYRNDGTGWVKYRDTVADSGTEWSYYEEELAPGYMYRVRVQAVPYAEWDHIAGRAVYSNIITFNLKETAYNVWVEGTQVTSLNKDDVLNDGGSVRYYSKKDDYLSGSVLVLVNAKLDQTKYKTYTRADSSGEVSRAVIYTEEPLDIILSGENTIVPKERTDATAAGIAMSSHAGGIHLRGEGSLTINSGADYIAIDAVGCRVICEDKVNVTAKGRMGIDASYIGTEDEEVAVEDSAVLYAFAYQSYQMVNGKYDYVDEPAIETPWLYVKDLGTLTAETIYNGRALKTWAWEFGQEYEIKVLKNVLGTGTVAEYVSNGIQPYAIETLNCYDGVTHTTKDHEELFRYVSIHLPEYRVEGITLSKSFVTFTKLGTSENVFPIYTPRYATYPGVTWSSSDESVATVSNGFIRPVSDGRAVITATSNDGGYTAECEVIVNLTVKYTLKDVSKLFQWWNGKQSLTAAEKKSYDVNGSSVTDLRDAGIIFRMVS